MKKSILLIAAATLASGCVSTATKTIDAQGVSALRLQSVVRTARDMPDFSEVTPVKANFGLIGGLAMIYEGNKTVANYHIADPAVAIADALLGAMQSSHGTQTVVSPVRIDSEDPARIADLAKGKARYVLDVRTVAWIMMYFPTDWTHYRIMYSAKARLIDVDARTLVAEAFCKRLPESNAGAPSFDEMLALNAARLKSFNAMHAQSCADSLGRDMLALLGPVRMTAPALAAAVPVPVQAPAPAPVPVPAPTPIPVQAQAQASVNGAWQAVMTCARAGRGAHAEAYEARFAVEIRGSVVSVHRRTAEVVESLSGLAANGHLELQGMGHRLAEPARPWRLQIGGDFPLGTTSYQGKGSMSAGGRPLRKCELNLTRA